MERNAYIVWSLRRSGAHGFEEWLFPHLPNYAFENNANVASPIGQNEKYINTKNLVVGYEDIPLDIVGERTEENFRSVSNVFNIIIRDPYNLFASRLRKMKTIRECLWTGESSVCGSNMPERPLEKHLILRTK
jgi:hypothetical protein